MYKILELLRPKMTILHLQKKHEMTIFDQFRRKNSNISFFYPYNATEIKTDHFSSFSRICSFWTKNGTLTHCVKAADGEPSELICNYLHYVLTAVELILIGNIYSK